MSEKISARLVDSDSNIRYVAMNQRELIVEIEENTKRPSLFFVLVPVSVL